MIQHQSVEASRLCKGEPRWNLAIQDGGKVPVSDTEEDYAVCWNNEPAWTCVWDMLAVCPVSLSGYSDTQKVNIQAPKGVFCLQIQCPSTSVNPRMCIVTAGKWEMNDCQHEKTAAPKPLGAHVQLCRLPGFRECEECILLATFFTSLYREMNRLGECWCSSPEHNVK